MGTDAVLLGTYIVEVQIGFLCTLIVAGLYGFIAPWWKTTEGRYVFGLIASLALVLGNTTLRIWFRDDYPYTIIIGVVLFAFYIVAVIVMGVGIYRATIKRYLDIKRRNKSQ